MRFGLSAMWKRNSLMKSKRALLGLMLICILISANQPALAENAGASPERGEILVVYPEEAVRRGKEDNLSAIAQVMFSLRYQVDWVEAGKAGDEIRNYNKVIWTATVQSDRLDPSILDGYEGYLMVLGRAEGMERFGLAPVPELRGSKIGAAEYNFPDNKTFYASVNVVDVGTAENAVYTNGRVDVLGQSVPFISGSERFRYIPLIDYNTDFAKAVLMQEFEQWFWTWDTGMHTWAEHLVLDEVYPFTDPERLQKIVEYMVDLKMNFVISVMPIYEHDDYPAMQRFCEILRFAQANGGGIILHAPIIQTSLEMDELAEQINEAAENYIKNGVWLLGMELPSEWLFKPEILDVMRITRTIFFDELDAFGNHPVSDYDFRSYLALGSRQIVPAYKLDETGTSHIARCSTAVYVHPDVTENEELFAIIDAVKDAPIPMQSLWDMDQAIYYAESKYLLWDRNTLTVNGEQKFNSFIPAEFEKDFDYKRNIYYRFVTNLTQQNHFLMGMSGAVLVLFIFLVFQSRKQMRNRFLKNIPKEQEGKES